MGGGEEKDCYVVCQEREDCNFQWFYDIDRKWFLTISGIYKP
jgi:hypothetical protein